MINFLQDSLKKKKKKKAIEKVGSHNSNIIKVMEKLKIYYQAVHSSWSFTSSYTVITNLLHGWEPSGPVPGLSVRITWK